MLSVGWVVSWEDHDWRNPPSCLGLSRSTPQEDKKLTKKLLPLWRLRQHLSRFLPTYWLFDWLLDHCIRTENNHYYFFTLRFSSWAAGDWTRCLWVPAPELNTSQQWATWAAQRSSGRCPAQRVRAQPKSANQKQVNSAGQSLQSAIDQLLCEENNALSFHISFLEKIKTFCHSKWQDFSIISGWSNPQILNF